MNKINENTNILPAAVSETITKYMLRTGVEAHVAIEDIFGPLIVNRERVPGEPLLYLLSESDGRPTAAMHVFLSDDGRVVSRVSVQSFIGGLSIVLEGRIMDSLWAVARDKDHDHVLLRVIALELYSGVNMATVMSTLVSRGIKFHWGTERNKARFFRPSKDDIAAREIIDYIRAFQPDYRPDDKLLVGNSIMEETDNDLVLFWASKDMIRTFSVDDRIIIKGTTEGSSYIDSYLVSIGAVLPPLFGESYYPIIGISHGRAVEEPDTQSPN